MEEKKLDSSQEAPESEESQENSIPMDEIEVEEEAVPVDESKLREEPQTEDEPLIPAEPTSVEEPSQDLDTPESPEPPPIVEESRTRRFFRRTIRWAAGLLTVFALGFLVAILVFYVPARRSLSDVEKARDQANQLVDELNDELAAEKVRGDQRVADVEAEMETLSAQITSLEEQINGLEGELSDSTLHIHILSSLADVTSAQLAIIQEDLEGARLALSNTPETLDALLDMVGDDQQDAVSAMQQRLTLVLGAMEEDSTTSLADLGILATNLLKLENTLFVEP